MEHFLTSSAGVSLSAPFSMSTVVTSLFSTAIAKSIGVKPSYSTNGNNKHILHEIIRRTRQRYSNERQLLNEILKQLKVELNTLILKTIATWKYIIIHLYTGIFKGNHVVVIFKAYNMVAWWSKNFFFSYVHLFPKLYLYYMSVSSILLSNKFKLY